MVCIQIDIINWLKSCMKYLEIVIGFHKLDGIRIRITGTFVLNHFEKNPIRAGVDVSSGTGEVIPNNRTTV